MKRLLFAILLPALAWAAQSPFDGTWKIDLNQVKLPDKPEVFLLQNGTYECSTCVPRISVKADGSDQPVTGTKSMDTLAVKVVNDKTVDLTSKKGGKVIGSEKDIVSEDGKTVTIEFTSYPESSKQPVTGKVTFARVAPGPAGSHALSGSWRMQKANAVSDNALSYTYKGSAEGLTMKAATGETYDAKFDGKDYPIKGDRAGSTVSLKKVSDSAIVETIMRDGKIVQVNHMTVSADGKSLTVKSEEPERGTTSTFVARKQ